MFPEKQLPLPESLGLCYSPESNGMAEAFVKTFKRDYIAFYDPLNAQSLMSNLHSWFEDYNNNAPHKGLKNDGP
ncbi:integrase core domain-containing protein [Legionella septentrionalis]|nr:hypothetical protein ELY14_03870 [Legionella septentrionalis]RUR15390.1 hypothetical protein ELY10_06200 [Legionella septentrionalis]